MKIVIFALVCIIVFLSPAPVFAGSPMRNTRVPSYIYNRFVAGEDGFLSVHAPLPYRFYRSVNASDMGVPALTHINDLFYRNGLFFITHGSSLIITNRDFVAIHILEGVYVDGVFNSFGILEGIFVTDNGDIYIAEPAAGHVIHLDSDLNLARYLGHPEGLLIPGGLTYQPREVAVDQNGRIFVISTNILEGIVEKNPDGTFNRFFGVINVTFTPMELFWRTIATPAQRARMNLWLPMTFTNITIDNNGFVYAVLSDGTLGESVRRLNARGENILRRPDNFGVGDVVFNSFGIGIPVGPSIISDVDVTDFGVYYVYDRTRNRVFAYDNDGNLLFAFGGIGEREGLTQNIVGFVIADNLVVKADRQTQSFEVFERTSYGQYIIDASYHQYHANYMLAAENWRRVLEYNPYFQYANLGVGRALYRNGYFAEAQEYFLRAQSPLYYSRAFRETRTELLENNMIFIFVGLLAVVVFNITIKVIKRKRGIRQ